MNLIIDEGNSYFKLALFENRQIVKSCSFKPQEREEMHSWISDYLIEIKNAIISSVVNKGLDLSRYNFHIIQLHHHTALPIINNYKSPESLGKDRLANAVGAWFKNPNGNSLIIDLGTCIKYDLVNEIGEYIGGNISPGIKMRFHALNKFTDKLPLLAKSNLDFGFGIDTESSMYNGVEQGVYHEINGFIERYWNQFSELTIFMTGGDANYFDNQYKYSIFADSELTLYGLNEILRYNVKDI